MFTGQALRTATQPAFFGNSAQNDRICFRIEFRQEVVTRLNGCETLRNREASLGIEGQYHGGVIPPQHQNVKRSGSSEEIIPVGHDECATSSVRTLGPGCAAFPQLLDFRAGRLTWPPTSNRPSSVFDSIGTTSFLT